MRYIGAEDLYDLNCLLKEIKLASEMTEKDVLFQKKKLNTVIDELDEICISQGLCPFCGSEIETVVDVDPVCGKTYIKRCTSCNEEF